MEYQDQIDRTTGQVYWRPRGQNNKLDRIDWGLTDTRTDGEISAWMIRALHGGMAGRLKDR